MFIRGLLIRVTLVIDIDDVAEEDPNADAKRQRLADDLFGVTLKG